jgi:hypothetical protein
MHIPTFKPIPIIPSSNIRNIWYAESEKLLAVEFHNSSKKSFRGAVYVYQNVPKAFLNILDTEITKLGGSVGKIFNAMIRGNPLHPFEILVTTQLNKREGWKDLNRIICSRPGVRARLLSVMEVTADVKS